MVLFFGGGALMAALRWVELGRFPHGWLSALGGGALIATGFAVAVSGILRFRRHRTTANPMSPDAASAIVTDGIYRITRNPMYLGFALALTGWALALAHALAALVVPVFVAYITRFQIMPEERALASKFGPAYLEYLTRVRRWI